MRKPAALAEAVHTRPRSAASMAASSTFLVPVLLLLLCGLGPYPAAAHSHPGKGADGKATGPFCGWGWGIELPSDGGRGQDVGLCGLACCCGTHQGPRDP